MNTIASIWREHMLGYLSLGISLLLKAPRISIRPYFSANKWKLLLKHLPAHFQRGHYFRMGWGLFVFFSSVLEPPSSEDNGISEVEDKRIITMIKNVVNQVFPDDQVQERGPHHAKKYKEFSKT